MFTLIKTISLRNNSQARLIKSCEDVYFVYINDSLIHNTLDLREATRHLHNAIKEYDKTLDQFKEDN